MIPSHWVFQAASHPLQALPAVTVVVSAALDSAAVPLPVATEFVPPSAFASDDTAALNHGCITSVDGVFINIPFANQTGQFIATWKGTPSADNMDGTASLSDGIGSWGWFQRIPVSGPGPYIVSADWAGDIDGAGWAEVMFFSCTSGQSDANVVARIDVGNFGDIAFIPDNLPPIWQFSPDLSPGTP